MIIRSQHQIRYISLNLESCSERPKQQLQDTTPPSGGTWTFMSKSQNNAAQWPHPSESIRNLDPDFSGRPIFFWYDLCGTTCTVVRAAVRAEAKQQNGGQVAGKVKQLAEIVWYHCVRCLGNWVKLFTSVFCIISTHAKRRQQGTTSSSSILETFYEASCWPSSSSSPLSSAGWSWSDVHRVRLSRSSCIIRVESL